MKIAFDFGGVLSSHQWCREMAISLLKDGHEVYCITAASLESKNNGNHVALVKSLNIPFTGIEIISGNQSLVGNDAHYEAGLLKAEAMKRLNIDTIIDDVPLVIIAIREQGLIGLHLG
jgi:hypothetical protein